MSQEEMFPANRSTELLDRVRAGESGAVDQLLDYHRGSIQRIVQMRLDQRIRQRVDVSDVVQEVLVEASRRLREYLDRPVMAFPLWIRQIAMDRVIDAHRRHRRSAKRSVDREQEPKRADSEDNSGTVLPQQLAVDRQLTPAAALLQREIVGLVQEAVQRLPDQDRQIIQLRHQEQRSNQEIARLLRLTEPAASMRYLRALRRLRQLMADPETVADHDS
jgi:RNA polymerase sigma-70 factor (ECF subfamily)